MITLFSCPKPFRGHIDVIQRNAIKSWTLLRPRPEILLLGREEGSKSVCDELGLVHVPEVERNDFGTPMVDSVFRVAQARASRPTVCYVNADIMLMDDFPIALRAVIGRMLSFLIIGRRRDLDVGGQWDFDDADWEDKMRSLLGQKGSLHAPSGIDYFCFPRGFYAEIPPFTLGRMKWDNWLVWHAWSRGVPIVDATGAITAIHQNHEYAPDALKRIPGSRTARLDSSRLKWIDGHWVELGPEAQRNLLLAPDHENLNIWASTWMVDGKGRVGRRRWSLDPAYLYYRLKCVVPLRWPALGRMITGSRNLAKRVVRNRGRHFNDAGIDRR